MRKLSQVSKHYWHITIRILEDLKVAHQRREALTAAQERYNAKHLKEPEDCIMQFWVPKPTDRKVGE